ncbi:transcriptional regulator GcvA [Dongia soli]|uniref:Transcriptional regulator GcvA n=1 Tax=Dongia soli TaxID=600628 RepID=A0ABU5E6S4_9PROT|nr:transcriptional regulator GcvA [Dongia soli]MDY0881571.1 transcriptional regulator GcvA [Dongia soli]
MAGPLRRLPSLNALRAFWASARHGSFAAAAGELHVTASAVSLQVRQLEEELGVKLFQRTPKGLVLSPQGAEILPGVSDAFAQLQATLLKGDWTDDTRTLSVSVAPSFATKWLLPRLDRFVGQHPDIDVRVLATMELTDFAAEPIDLAIRYGHGRYPGLQADLLMRESVFPVCSPKLLEGRDAADLPALLRAATLLHDDSPDQDPTCPDWKSWLKASGISEVDWQRGPRFNQSNFVLEGAANGLGVALAKASLVQYDIADGRLVQLGDRATPIELAYFLVYPPERAANATTAIFRDWLMAEIAPGETAVTSRIKHRRKSDAA